MIIIISITMILQNKVYNTNNDNIDKSNNSMSIILLKYIVITTTAQLIYLVLIQA